MEKPGRIRTEGALNEHQGRHENGTRPLANALYLAPLNAEQSVAVIAAVVLDELMARGDYRGAMAVADVLLEHHPQFAYALVKKGTAAYRILEAEFFARYPEVADVPEDRRTELMRLQRVNRVAFQEAEAMGWLPLSR